MPLALKPALFRLSTSLRHCVDLPERSRPSRTINAPRRVGAILAIEAQIVTCVSCSSACAACVAVMRKAYVFELHGADLQFVSIASRTARLPITCAFSTDTKHGHNTSFYEQYNWIVHSTIALSLMSTVANYCRAYTPPHEVLQDPSTCYTFTSQQSMKASSR